jgi:hypothetical protein
LDSAEAEARAKAGPKGAKGKKLGAKPKKNLKFSKKLLSDGEDEAESESEEASDSDDYMPVKSMS